MKEYKPFLEVVGKMQNGDIADCESPHYRSVALINGIFYIVSRSTKDTKTVDVSDQDKWTLLASDKSRKYAIRPRYVDVVDAMKALQERKIVEWYDENDTKIVSMSTGMNFEALAKQNSEFADRGFFVLSRGKFVIKEE